MLSLFPLRIVFTILSAGALTGAIMIRLRRILLIFALLVLTPFFLQAREPTRMEDGIVRRVADGDTVMMVTVEGTKLRIRLYGIDAPETVKTNGRTGIVS